MELLGIISHTAFRTNGCHKSRSPSPPYGPASQGSQLIYLACHGEDKFSENLGFILWGFKGFPNQTTLNIGGRFVVLGWKLFTLHCKPRAAGGTPGLYVISQLQLFVRLNKTKLKRSYLCLCRSLRAYYRSNRTYPQQDILSQNGNVKSLVGEHISILGLGLSDPGEADSKNKSTIPNCIEYTEGTQEKDQQWIGLSN